jgi:hypothetical protein
MYLVAQHKKSTLKGKFTKHVPSSESDFSYDSRHFFSLSNSDFSYDIKASNKQMASRADILVFYACPLWSLYEY